MENVAHTLAGLLIADALVTLRGRRGDVRFARLAAITSALANNVPDGDLLYAGITGGKLGYMLHHRGHTHTIVVGLALGLVVAGIVLGVARRGAPLRAGDGRWLLALGAVGPVVHLGMDAWNVYGVHPFWPVHNGWFYGDAVFIVEPLLWAVGIPPLALSGSRVWRAVLFTVLALGMALPWLGPGLVSLGMRLALIAVAFVVTAVCWRARETWRAFIGLGAFVSVAALLLGLGAVARRQIEARVGATHDIALSAFPTNPWCWWATTVQTTADGELLLRQATVGITNVEACPRPDGETTAPLTPPTAASDERVRWEAELRLPLGRLRELARDHCQVAAMMRFVRVPFFIEQDGKLVIGDLRFDRQAELGFAEIKVPIVPATCPVNVPPWTPPRSDVLER